jgi:hypothetical protein
MIRRRAPDFAAQSDPDRNVQFRRRWAETPKHRRPPRKPRKTAMQAWRDFYAPDDRKGGRRG